MDERAEAAMKSGHGPSDRPAFGWRRVADGSLGSRGGQCAASRTLCTGTTLVALVLAAGCPGKMADDAGMPGPEAGHEGGAPGDGSPRADGDGPDPSPDGGDPRPGDSGDLPVGEAGADGMRVVVGFATRTDTVEDGRLTTGLIGVASLVARNDRGSAEPEQHEVGVVNLMSEARVALGGAAPATYGRLTLELAEGPWGSAMELRFVEGEVPPRMLLVEIRNAVSVDVRCAEAPAQLAPGAQVHMTLTLDVGSIRSTLARFELPDPTGSVVHVNEQQAPGATEAVEQALADAWTLRCTR